MRTQTVVIVAYDGAQAIDITSAAEVFGIANHMAGGSAYAVTIASLDGEDIGTSWGMRIGVHGRVEDVAGPVDTLVVPGSRHFATAMRDPALLGALTRETARSRRIVAVCTGSFLLGAIGRLDGRRATTHWMYLDDLAAAFPGATVDRDAIFVEDGEVHTSAGVTAGIDLALSIVEADYGAALARRVARYLVMFMQRPGGQAQFSVRMSAPATGSVLRPLLDSIAENPAADHRLAALSRRAGFSERHLTRVFARELDTTPARFVERTRVEAARALLETSDAPLDVIARECGLGSAETLRRVFAREIGAAPHAYRRRFRTTRLTSADRARPR